MNIYVEERHIFVGGLTKIRAEINDGLLLLFYTNDPTCALEAQRPIFKRHVILNQPQEGKKSFNPVQFILVIDLLI